MRQMQGGGGEEHDAPMPPVLKTALVWGLFMGVSSNLRYQVGARVGCGVSRRAGMAVGVAAPACPTLCGLGARQWCGPERACAGAAHAYIPYDQL